MSDQLDGWSDMPTNQSANNTIDLKFLVYTKVYSGPTWFVNLLATKHPFVSTKLTMERYIGDLFIFCMSLHSTTELAVAYHMLQKIVMKCIQS